jgi:hypothetical protein
MYALDVGDAQEIAEYHDLMVIDPNDDADPTALEWAERHGFTKRPDRAELRARIEALLYPLVGLLIRAVDGDQERPDLANPHRYMAAQENSQ